MVYNILRQQLQNKYITFSFNYELCDLHLLFPFTTLQAISFTSVTNQNYCPIDVYVVSTLKKKKSSIMTWAYIK